MCVPTKNQILYQSAAWWKFQNQYFRRSVYDSERLYLTSPVYNILVQVDFEDTEIEWLKKFGVDAMLE